MRISEFIGNATQGENSEMKQRQVYTFFLVLSMTRIWENCVSQSTVHKSLATFYLNAQLSLVFNSLNWYIKAVSVVI